MLPSRAAGKQVPLSMSMHIFIYAAAQASHRCSLLCFNFMSQTSLRALYIYLRHIYSDLCCVLLLALVYLSAVVLSVMCPSCQNKFLDLTHTVHEMQILNKTVLYLPMTTKFRHAKYEGSTLLTSLDHFIS